MVEVFCLYTVIELPSSNSPVALPIASSPRTTPDTPSQPLRGSSRGLWPVFHVNHATHT